jgi:DNA polymerase III delta prime subunit
MYKHKNYGKFIDTERKYSPNFISDLIFPNAHVKSVVTAYASGEVRRPLILCGRNGTGKSLIAKLLPKAIEEMEEVQVTHVKAHKLNSDSEVEELFSRNKMFDSFFTVNGQRYTYNVIEEMNSCIKGRNAFRIALDKYRGTDLTIITTNEIAQIDKGIRSRCEVLEVPACTPVIFFPHAKRIMEKEGIEIEEGALLAALEASYDIAPDNRGYYKVLDGLFRDFHLAQEARKQLQATLA